MIFKHDGKVVYMLAGVENQMDIHYAMVVKNMLYDALNYASQVEKIAYEHKKTKDLKDAEFLSGFAKEDKLIPVLTITIYWSSKEWDGARSLHEMFDIEDEHILEYVTDYKLNLITPHDIKDLK